MKISREKLDKICKKNDLTINRMLAESGVSRNAFYSLLRKDNILPRSITSIADQLDVSPAEFLETETRDVLRLKKLHRKAKDIHGRHKNADYDNILHTLLLADEPPIERLRRALRRGRQFNF